MHPLRIFACLFLVLVAMSTTASFRGPAPVSATTGPSDVPALYLVPLAIARQYPGQYSLQSAVPGARITHAQMIINFNSLGFLSGVGQFTAYDAHGYKTLWVADMYNFRQTKAGMEIPLLLANAKQLGTMYLHVAKTGNLEGQLVLSGKRYPIAWHKNFSFASSPPLRCSATKC